MSIRGVGIKAGWNLNINGIQEVGGSIPFSSTDENQRLGDCVLPGLFVFSPLFYYDLSNHLNPFSRVIEELNRLLNKFQ
jgi:hypothetical protein